MPLHIQRIPYLGPEPESSFENEEARPELTFTVDELSRFLAQWLEQPLEHLCSHGYLRHAYAETEPPLVEYSFFGYAIMQKVPYFREHPEYLELALLVPKLHTCVSPKMFGYIRILEEPAADYAYARQHPQAAPGAAETAARVIWAALRNLPIPAIILAPDPSKYFAQEI